MGFLKSRCLSLSDWLRCNEQITAEMTSQIVVFMFWFGFMLYFIFIPLGKAKQNGGLFDFHGRFGELSKLGLVWRLIWAGTASFLMSIIVFIYLRWLLSLGYETSLDGGVQSELDISRYKYDFVSGLIEFVLFLAVLMSFLGVLSSIKHSFRWEDFVVRRNQSWFGLTRIMLLFLVALLSFSLLGPHSYSTFNWRFDDWTNPFVDADIRDMIFAPYGVYFIILRIFQLFVYLVISHLGVDNEVIRNVLWAVFALFPVLLVGVGLWLWQKRNSKPSISDRISFDTSVHSICLRPNFFSQVVLAVGSIWLTLEACHAVYFAYSSSAVIPFVDDFIASRGYSLSDRPLQGYERYYFTFGLLVLLIVFFAPLRLKGDRTPDIMFFYLIPGDVLYSSFSNFYHSGIQSDPQSLFFGLHAKLRYDAFNPKARYLAFYRGQYLIEELSSHDTEEFDRLFGLSSLKSLVVREPRSQRLERLGDVPVRSDVDFEQRVIWVGIPRIPSAAFLPEQDSLDDIDECTLQS